MADLTKVGRYQIVERVGRGGMGVVYRGYDPLLEREVAIKLMAGDFSGDDEARTRFYREAKAIARLQHRNIVTIFECGEEDGYPFLVMEFLRGSTLAERMRDAPGTSSQTLADKLDIISQLCTGLQFAHSQSIIHRDVKPTNIWLMDDGTVKLLDFGIAKLAESTATRHGLVVGSAAYMSPEQVSGKSIDGRSDVFSAGVVLYELLSGRKPFEADTPTAVMMKILNDEPPPVDTVRPGLPSGVVSMVHKALKKRPDERFGRAQDFGSALLIARRAIEATDLPHQDPAYLAETVLAESPYRRDKATVPGHPTLLAPAADRQRSRLRTIAIAATAIAAAAVLGIVLFKMLGRSASPQNSTATVAVKPVVSPSESKPAIATNPPISEPQPVVTEPVKPVSDADAAAAQQAPALPTAPTGPPAVKPPASEPTEQALDSTPAPATKPTPPFEPRRSNRLPFAPLTLITIEGEYPFEVLDGPRVISERSETHELKVPAPRTLLLRAPEYLLAQVIKVEAGRDRVQHFTAPLLGKLTIRTPLETCSVMIGGRDFGFPPIVDQPLVARSYRVELRCPTGPGASAIVVVPPGETRVRIIR
ncbi:MAG: protein kinase [Acidobacteria bacterium]|nr:protein kinase [Acidobacteriota bacterium]